MRPSSLTSSYALAALSLVAPRALAEIVVNVDQGATAPLPIAIPGFRGAPVGAQISQVIIANLERSGLFRPLDPASFPDAPADVNLQPGFDGWKAISAQALLTGQASETDGRLKVDFRLWDVFAGEQLLGLQFTATPENWRRVAHKISDAVYEKLTGEKGYFDTRVVFVAESGPRAKPIRRLAIMDQDGANPSYLTDGSYLVFTPRFSGASQEITYMALRPTGSNIYLLNIETGRQETLGHFPGMVFAPRFSPDGAKGGLLGGKGRQHRRLCDGPGQPRHHPAHLRPGHRHLAVLLARRRPDRVQLRPRRFAPALCDGRRRLGDAPHLLRVGPLHHPGVEPDGKLIAFTKQEGGEFHIGVMRPDGSDERLLTTSYLDEGPPGRPTAG